MLFENFRIAGIRASYHRVPISMLELFRSEMAKQGKFFRVRYRGPRFNTLSARYRSYSNKASTCLKEDATHFSVYEY